MNASVEFHDSQVRTIETSQRTVRLVFDQAYVHHSDGRPGIDAGGGYVQPAELIFEEVACSVCSDHCVGPVSTGTVSIDGSAYALLPVPFRARGRVEAEFVFANGERLQLSAKSVALIAHGAARFVETFAA